MGHAKAVLQPSWDYYNNMFHKYGKDCYDMRIMASAADIFNPQHLKGKTEADFSL